MTPEQFAAVEALVGQLRDAYQGISPLSPAAVHRARAIVRLVDHGRVSATEDEQQRLDALHGLVRWGQLAYPVLRVDPAMFAAQRRERRVGPPPAPRMTPGNWGD